MTIQSNFMVVAPIYVDRAAGLRTLMAEMNYPTGVVNPQNALVPFGQFDRLHFARFLILDDKTLDDITVYGVPRRNFPVALVFLGDCDGPAVDFLVDLAARAGDGLRRVFSHCQDFPKDVDLVTWMQQHEQPPAAAYVNWVGRTMRQIREEMALYGALEANINAHAAEFRGKKPQERHAALRKFAAAEIQAGRLTLTPVSTSFVAWLKNALHAAGVLLVLVMLAPLLLLYLPLFLVQLRRRERSDPVITPPPDPQYVAELAALEDHNITNQFSAIGALKPGRFRRMLAVFFLWMLNNAARHIYYRGHLTRIGTIHFARWVFLNDKQRLLFASNYDGSLESYMDDFINKVGWGLNLVFGNGVGYPRTAWLMLHGAKNEQEFKHFLRRHQLPTEVWYNACPGLTALDLERNTRIRAGIDKPSMSDAEIEAWLRLF
jgi:hypothetical protein